MRSTRVTALSLKVVTLVDFENNIIVFRNLPKPLDKEK